MSMYCPICKSDSNVDTDNDAGQVVCVKCGNVLEETNHIVSDLQFTETAKGAASVFGQFVSSSTSVYRRLPSWSRESREATQQAGRKMIMQIAGQLDLKQTHVQSATRVFNLAVQANFIQGRKTKVVCCVCLYIACRQHKTPHMLLDFAEQNRINVYVLGATFLKLLRAVHMQASVPLVDPALYVRRFASRLAFEGKSEDVAKTALKIVSRMKRDWIQVGRRPAGICGAALLIAARCHGFKRSQREVVEVVKVCDITLRERLRDFMDTPTAEMTLEEFKNLEDAEKDNATNENDEDEEQPPCDPPAFRRGLENPKVPHGLTLDVQWDEERLASEAEQEIAQNPELQVMGQEVENMVRQGGCFCVFLLF